MTTTKDEAARTPGRVAYEAFHESNQFAGSYEHSHHRPAWDYAAAAVLAHAPAPASPGVPDSLRVLSEAAVEAASATYYDAMMGQEPHTYGWAGKPEAFKAKVRERMAQALAAAIATHPAGQSAGSGAEGIELDGDPGSNLAPWLLSSSDEEVIEQLMRRSAGDVACLFFPAPHNVVDPIRRTYHTGRPPRQQRLLAELLRRLKPAPDSTRTGQGEAHAVFDPARTTSDPYDDRPGPWYDMRKVREIEAATGITFAVATLEQDASRATDRLVERFAEAMRTKLRAAEAKYGWQNGWLKSDWAADCQRDLMRHVGKGDPLDVAAYAAFCWHHGWPTAPDSTRMGQGEATDGWVLVPSECTAEMIRAARARAREMLGGALNALAFEDCWDAALAARPAAPEAQGVERVRHVKRGTEYEVLGEAEAQVSVPDPGHRKGIVRHIQDGDKLTVYRGSDGKLWCRFTDEFRDGRFVPAPPASSGQEG